MVFRHWSPLHIVVPHQCMLLFSSNWQPICVYHSAYTSWCSWIGNISRWPVTVIFTCDLTKTAVDCVLLWLHILWLFNHTIWAFNQLLYNIHYSCMMWSLFTSCSCFMIIVYSFCSPDVTKQGALARCWTILCYLWFRNCSPIRDIDRTLFEEISETVTLRCEGKERNSHGPSRPGGRRAGMIPPLSSKLTSNNIVCLSVCLSLSACIIMYVCLYVCVYGENVLCQSCKIIHIVYLAHS